MPSCPYRRKDRNGRGFVRHKGFRRSGISIPADTPVLTVAAAAAPRIIYGDNATTMQVAEESGVRIIPLDGGSGTLIEVPAPAGKASSGSSAGCNTGLGTFALLAAVPLFLKRRQ